jgi:hypothetical protein
MRQHGRGGRYKPRALRKLASDIFGLHDFQADDNQGHDSVDDAAMAMELCVLAGARGSGDGGWSCVVWLAATMMFAMVLVVRRVLLAALRASSLFDAI